jgi:hypothetical protein
MIAMRPMVRGNVHGTMDSGKLEADHFCSRRPYFIVSGRPVFRTRQLFPPQHRPSPRSNLAGNRLSRFYEEWIDPARPKLGVRERPVDPVTGNQASS